MTLFDKLLTRAKATDHVFMVAAAIVIGCAGGFGAIVFRLLISGVMRVGWGGFTVSLEQVRGHPAWWIVLVPWVSPDQDLDAVLRIFAGKNRDELPVLDAEGRLLAVVSRGHLLDAYNSELMKRDMVAGLSGSVTATATEEVHLGEGFRMAELDAPGAFLGRSIRDLDVRARYGAQVLLLRRAGPGGDALEILPEPDTVVERGDHLVVLGREDDLERLRRL
jgi:CBS domain-containing protein